MGAEFAHLDRLWDYDPDQPNRRGRIEFTQQDIERFLQLRDDGKPALIFAAHLANWELPAICAATYQLDSAVLYRRPNIAAIDRWLRETRTASMGELIPTGLDAPVKIADALKRGAHVGMLVDQYYVRGVEVTFFGRRTRANPLLARLAQHFDCPIHGIRIDPPAGQPLPRRADRGDRAGARRRRQDRYRRHHAGHHQRGRRLGARASRAVAVAAPALAAGGRVRCVSAGLHLRPQPVEQRAATSDRAR